MQFIRSLMQLGGTTRRKRYNGAQLLIACKLFNYFVYVLKKSKNHRPKLTGSGLRLPLHVKFPSPNFFSFISKMRFKASIRNINTFTSKHRNSRPPKGLTDALSGLTASLSSLGKDVWLQLNNEQLRFTVVPEQGSQVWAYVLRPSTWLIWDGLTSV